MHIKVVAFKVRPAFNRLNAQKCRREELLSIAQLLQRKFACDVDERIYGMSRLLDLIMRAVLATLDNRSKEFPGLGRSVLADLLSGVTGLIYEMDSRGQDDLESYP